ncbi:LysR family transcriptional regulator [Actinomycetes bacterium KLBMP 9759]
MQVDPHLLRTFTAVARLGSFSGAARELGYTQSAVSQHVAALEADLGTELLRRRPVVPTPAGERLLEHAGPLLLRLASARADVARLGSSAAGSVRIAASSHAVVERVATSVAAVRPAAQITVRVIGRAAAVAAVATGDADIGLVDGIAAPSDPLPLEAAGLLARVAVAERPLVVALPQGHPLATRRGVRLADLADARWIDAPDAAVELDRLRDVCGAGAFRAALRVEGADSRWVLALVAAGCGLAAVPAPALAGAPVVGLELVEPRVVHRVELLHGPAPGGAAGAVVKLLARS